MTKRINKKFKKHSKKLIKKYIKGNIALYILLGILILLSAGFAGFWGNVKSRPQPLKTSVALTCCDTGSGEACKPQEDQALTFKTVNYGLLKTSVQFMEGNLHLRPEGETPNHEPIIVNIGDEIPIPTDLNPPSDCKNGEDKYFRKYAPPEDLTDNNKLITYCVSTPNDQLIFVCKKNCQVSTCPANYLGRTSCYGDKDTVFDVYFRLEDYTKGGGVPNFIKNCDENMGSQPLPSGSTGQQKIIIKDNKEPQSNLQLKNFVIELEQNINPWLSPLCKPAIYLYPPEKTSVNVKIKPEGKLTLTIPDYPENGWKVIAYPDGKIITDNKAFEYLYYEAQIPNELVDNQTKEGYVIRYTEIESALNTLLAKLGLNEKEKSEFLDYWIKALPKSNYYFVGVVSQSLFNEISPLNINPKPDNIIRVALYFKPLDKKTDINPPTFTNIKRGGFTVVEWGGLFKTDKTHPFTCLM